MGRIYTVTRAVASKDVNPPADLIELAAPSTMALRILSAHIGQASDYGDAEAEGLVAILARAATSGTGGSSATPAKHSNGDPASSVTAELDNTSQAGTQTTILQEGFNLQLGWFYNPTPDEAIIVPPSGILVLGLAGTVDMEDAVNMTYRITFEEIG